MKRVLLLTIMILTTTQVLLAQKSNKVTYPIVVSFQSECCGVPSDTSIRTFITSFKKKYKIKKITATEIGPMGREGEYYLAFNLKELNKKQAKDFITRIQKVEKLPSDRGMLSYEEKKVVDRSLIPQRATSKKVVF